jgi:methylmalonyl-CoA mutase N-terminal domain/subunit
VIPAIEASFFQKEIADSAFRYQQELEQKRRIMIGVNDFTVDEEVPIEILRIDPRLEAEQVGRVREVRAKRDQARCSRALTGLRKAAAGSDNLMPYILEAVRAYATEGEIMKTLIEVFGIYTEQAVV